MKLKNLFKRWKDVRALIDADEYFIAISNYRSNKYDDRYYVKEYHYMKNTDRHMFYNFTEDYINNQILTEENLNNV